MRVAFMLIGGKSWTGGYNYLLNLVRVLAMHESGRITPLLFFGIDTAPDEALPFADIAGVEVIHSPLMNQARKSRSLFATILLGRDTAVRDLFVQHQVDLVFESAQFFGTRLGLPALAWIPDFQHRYLPHMFTRAGYWKRELGFRAQVAAGRSIMLSSEDSRQSCVRLYPSTAGRASAVRFAVPPAPPIAAAEARALADGYGLPERFYFMPNQFSQHKNHLLVLQALSLLRERGHPVVVAASGKSLDARNPDYFKHVQRTIANLGVEQEFRLLGMIPYPHLAVLMRASVALLNPSLFEGWSTTVEEARSSGTPMLLSDLAVHHEQAGDQARYFDRTSAVALADALHGFDMLTEAQREQRMTAAHADAEQRVRRFGAEFAALAERSAALAAHQ